MNSLKIKDIVRTGLYRQIMDTFGSTPYTSRIYALWHKYDDVKDAFEDGMRKFK